jgi:hypothetical protein
MAGAACLLVSGEAQAVRCLPMNRSGTLIYWPWGGRGLRRDALGRIRVVPRLAGLPVDGPEAIHLTGVR